MEQAILNLLMNAFDSTSENGKIGLIAERKEEIVVISVENEGKIIPKEIEAKIFEPFFTAKPKGTGLGLSIVQNIAHAHKGIAVLAKNENGIVRFEIQIPLKK